MKAKPNNILIITFDCLRPDHLCGLGYKGTHTPTFDWFINKGTTFVNAYCQAPNTWISHASLFTGCNPYLHGVRTPVQKVSDELCVMAEIFKDAGYATFGLPAMSLLSEKSGFSRGFDEYSLDKLQSTEGVLAHRYYRSADDTLALTIDWLKEASRPFLGWIHYFGIHKVEDELLDLPDRYRRMYSPYAQYYDGKVSFADEHFLAPLTRELTELGLLDNTVVVLWSDHGENLHAVEHDLYWGHNWGLGEEVMRTVLIMSGPGLPSGEKREDVVQSIDILPTLLHLTGLSPLPQCEGQSVINGLLPHDTLVYMENLCQGFAAVRQGHFKFVLSEIDQDSKSRKGKLGWRLNLIKKTIWELLPRMFREIKRGSAPLESWWKARGEPEQVLERLLERGRCELYDLTTDPEQHNNLADARPELVAEYKLLLRQRANCTVASREMIMTDEERNQVEERLRSLGYF